MKDDRRKTPDRRKSSTLDANGVRDFIEAAMLQGCAVHLCDYTIQEREEIAADFVRAAQLIGAEWLKARAQR